MLVLWPILHPSETNADLILAQCWQILGNACYILWKSSINKRCGYHQHGVSISDFSSNSLRQAFPNQVQTRGPMTLVTVNGAFGLTVTCFIPAPASWNVSLFISHSFLLTDVLPAGGKADRVYISLCLSEDAGKSHPPSKSTRVTLLLSVFVWGEWSCSWVCTEPGSRTQIRLCRTRWGVDGERTNMNIFTN